MDNTNMQKDCPITAVPRELQYAGELFAEFAVMHRNAALCDVFLQAEDEDTPSETASKVTDKAMYAAASEETNEVVDGPPNQTTTGASGTSNEARGVWAHRMVLAAASKYFKAMFLGRFEERKREVVIIKGMDCETLRAVINYIYSPSSLVVTAKNAQALLAAASLLDVDGVRDAACEFILHALAADNALGIYAFAELHGCTALLSTATQYIHEHIEEVLNGEEFLALKLEELYLVLDIVRPAMSEKRVLDAVLRWTLHCLQDRRPHLNYLLQAVRLSLVPRLVLAEYARTEPLASAEPRALHQVIEGLAADRIPPTALLLIGGYLSGGPTNSVLACSLPGGSWQSVAAIPEPRATIAAAVLEGRVYVVGGHDGIHRSVFVYDATRNSWSSGPPMNTARKWAAVTTLAGRLFVVGGWNNIDMIPTRFNSVEAFDPREGVWRPIASMTTCRSAHGVAAMDWSVYAVGGFDGSISLNSTERYDLVAGRWQTMENMAAERNGLGVGVVGNAMYAVGGFTGSKSLESVERYRVDSGWEPAPSMPSARFNAAVTAHGGNLYVVGGHDYQYLSTVSMFNPETAMWSGMSDIPAGRDVAAAVVIPWPAP